MASGAAAALFTLNYASSDSNHDSTESAHAHVSCFASYVVSCAEQYRAHPVDLELSIVEFSQCIPCVYSHMYCLSRRGGAHSYCAVYVGYIQERV